MLDVPKKLAAGTNRTRVLASPAKSNAAPAVGEPKLVQFVPPLIEYCHAPFVLSTAVTAIPSELPFTSLALPEMRAETSAPALVTSFSLIVARSLAPVSVGASLINRLELAVAEL